jgi:hypothetical protein
MHLKFVQEATCWVFQKFKHPDKKYNGKSVTVFKKKRSLLYMGQGLPFYSVLMSLLHSETTLGYLTFCTEMSKVITPSQ